MKKFELTTEFVIDVLGRKLFRIKALIDFGSVKAGEFGGFVEKEENLSHNGDAWVSGNAKVSGDAKVSNNACVSGNADYACIKGFGIKFRHTTFYKTRENGICVKCGCFNGSLEQFREQVKKTRTGKIAKEYLAIADLMEEHFKEEE